MTYPQAMAAAVVLRYYPPEVWRVWVAAVSKLTDEQWDYVRKLDSDGVPRSEIAQRVGDAFGVRITPGRLGQVLGAKDRPGPSEESRAIRILLNDDELTELRRIAESLGYTGYIGKTTGVGSMSELLRAIARGDVRVERSHR